MEEETIKYLDLIAERVRQIYAIDFNYDGVKVLEQEICNQRDDFKTWSESLQNTWVDSFAAFLGTCMIKNYGGHWAMYGNQIGVKLDDSGVFANPFSKVWKQFQPDGMFDSISSFYLIAKNFDTIVEQGKPEELKKKPWWKRK